MPPETPSAYYPVMLEIAGLPCLVVGGGPVALRKVEGLLAAGARVRLVSPEAVPELAALAAAGRLTWERRPYAPGDAAGHALVFACTGVPDVDGAAARDARRPGVWVNVASAPALGNMILPAVHRAGRLTLAVSTGGASPALARAVRDRLAPLLEAVREELAAALEEQAARRERRRGGLAGPRRLLGEERECR